MLDDRIIQEHDFLKDDAFIKTEEFNNFLFKVKQNELSLQMALGDTQEKVAEMVQKLQEYDPTSETLTPMEGRELLRRSGMLLFPGWEINSSFLLDQIRKQEKSISFEETNMFGETKVIGFNIDAKTMAIWSMALAHDKPTLMEIK